VARTAGVATITTMPTVRITMSNDLSKRSAYCPILRQTNKRKAATSNTAQEEGPRHDEKI
jgi:hypothetical protein